MKSTGYSYSSIFVIVLIALKSLTISRTRPLKGLISFK